MIWGKIDQYLLTHSKRYKLFRICKAIGIKPYRWVRDFALGKIHWMDMTRRRTGKTMATMLRILMLPPGVTAGIDTALNADPDWQPNNSARRKWYWEEYRKLSLICHAAGIPVNLPPKDGRSIGFFALDVLHRIWEGKA